MKMKNIIYPVFALSLILCCTACSDNVVQLQIEESPSLSSDWKEGLNETHRERQFNDMVKNYWHKGKPGVITKDFFGVTQLRKPQEISLYYNQIRKNYPNPDENWQEVVAWSDEYLLQMTPNWSLEQQYSNQIQEMLLRVVDDYLIHTDNLIAKEKLKVYLETLIRHQSIDIRVLQLAILSLQTNVDADRYTDYLTFLQQRVDYWLEYYPEAEREARQQYESEQEELYKDIILRNLYLKRTAYKTALDIDQWLNSL